MTKELIALVNKEPNPRFSNTHELLTLVNKPESLETALYHPEEKDKALEDLEKHKEETGSHIGIRKLTVEKV